MDLTPSPFASSVEALCVACHMTRVLLLDAHSRGHPTYDVSAHLRHRFGIDDAVAQYQVAHWNASFGQPLDAPRRFLNTMERLAVTLFTRVDGAPALRGGDVAERLARAVDPHLLAVFYPNVRGSRDEDFYWPMQSAADGHVARRILAEGSADLHVHLGGALDPALFWVLLMGARVSFHQLRNLPSGDDPANAADAWVRAVAEAAWNRLRLFRLLEPDRATTTLRRVALDAPEWLGANVVEAPSAQHVFAMVRAWQGDHDPGDSHPARVPTLRELRGAPDGVISLLANDRRHLYRLVAALRAAVKREHPVASDLARMLHSHLAVRNAFHQALTFETGTAGLYRFSELNRRRRFLVDTRRSVGDRARRRQLRAVLELERFRVAAAASALTHDTFTEDRFAGKSGPLRQVEVRVNLRPATEARHILRAWLAGLGDHFRAVTSLTGCAPRHQFGFIVHFGKSSARSRVRADALQAARALAGLLSESPQLRRFFVGIDAAGRERDARPRDFLGAYRRLRALTAGVRPLRGEPPIRLGWTFHVGEDPWEFLSGLRQIDEVISALLGSDHPRIGHGLALMRDPAASPRGNATAYLPIGDHLLDLVWAWGRFGERSLADHVRWIEHHAGALFARFAAGATPDFERCWRAMDLADAPFPSTIHTGAEDHKDTDPFEITLSPVPDEEAWLLRELGFEGDAGALVEVPRSPEWIACVAAAQGVVRERVLRRNVCIEACPTGNAVIGGFDALGSLPYRNLTEAGVALTLNTDNPGLFRTSLIDEYDRTYRALCEIMAPSQAVDWLRARVQQARTYSFLGVAVPVGADASRLVSEELDHLMFRSNRF